MLPYRLGREAFRDDGGGPGRAATDRARIMTTAARIHRACLVAGMLALGARGGSAGASHQLDCPALLTEKECLAYHDARRLARSAQERAQLEAGYAVLLRERANLCPQSDAAVTEPGNTPSTPKRRPLAGHRISM